MESIKKELISHKRKYNNIIFKKNKRKCQSININYEHASLFPNELLAKIFVFLSFSNFVNISLVCKHWYHLSKTSFIMKKIPLDLSFCNINGKIKKIKQIIHILKMKQFNNIEMLCIGAIYIGKATIKKIFDTCPKLKYFKINTDFDINGVGQINENSLKQIGYYSNGKLKGLSIDYLGYILDEQSFERFSNLKYLNIKGGANKIGNLIVLISNYCNKLISLDLNNKIKKYTNSAIYDKSQFHNTIKLNNISLELLSKNCPNLIYLKLKNCFNVTNEGIITLTSNCKNLITLRLFNCKTINDFTLKILAENCSKLKTLELLSTNVNITEIGYNALHSNGTVIVNIPIKGLENNYNIESYRKKKIQFIFSKILDCLVLILNKKYNSSSIDTIKLYLTNEQIYEFFTYSFPINKKNKNIKKITNSIILMKLQFIAQKFEQLIFNHVKTNNSNLIINKKNQLMLQNYDNII